MTDNSQKTVAKLSLLLLGLSCWTGAGTAVSAQNNTTNYTPGQSIKFGTAGSSPSSSFSGTTYAPPSRDGKTGTDSAQSPYSASTPLNTTEPSTAGKSDQSGQRGLGSLIRGVKNELRNSGVLNHAANQFTNGYQPGSGFQSGASAGSQFGSNTPLNYVRMPDGTYRANSISGGDSPRLQQSTASAPSGDLIQYVTSDMPMPVGPDVESLIPAELHSKAYGIELHRDAPMNGAEGYPQ